MAEAAPGVALHPSDEQLQRLLNDQLDAAEGRALETHVEDCPVCPARLEALAADPQVAAWLALEAGDSPPGPPQSLTFPGQPTERGPLGQLGPYHIVRELGLDDDGRPRGGMGRVFLAHDENLQREVALKVLRPELAIQSEYRERFIREGQRAATVNDEHVVRVFYAGQTEGFALPYLVMEFVRGEPLSALLRRREKLRPNQVAGIVRQVALGLLAAHDQGLVHRDLKPDNILLEQDGDRFTARLTDFGLACEVDLPDGEARPTPADHVVGTPDYMSPEQILAPQRVDGRSDLYSLGVVLYEMLTGQRPITGATRLDVLRQVPVVEPVAPRQLNRSVPLDLETLCLKCLRKEPHQRFASARELADELQRFLSGEPIRTRPMRAFERFWNWARRNPAVAGLGAAVILSLLAGTTVASYFAFQARAEARLAREERLNADRRRYVSDMRLVQRAWEDNEMDRVRELLAGLLPEQTGGTDLRALEWYYWRRLSHSEVHTLRGHTNQVGALAFSPDGQRLASASFDQTVRVWDVGTGRECFTCKGHGAYVISVTFSPDGKHVASTSTDGMVKVWDAASGEEAFSCETGSAKFYTRRVAYSPDGKSLAGAAQRIDPETGGLRAAGVRVWDAATGKVRAFALDGEESVLFGHLVYSPDGTRLAGVVCTQDQEGQMVDRLKVWDAATGKEVLSLKDTFPPLGSLVYNPAGTRLAGASMTGPVMVWDAATLKAVCTCKGHSSEIHEISFSRDGSQLAGASSDKTVKLWDSATGLLVRSIRGHADGVLAVVFSPDGQRLASSSYDQTVKVWDAAVNQEPLARSQNANDFVGRLLFSPDSRHLAGIAGEGSIKVWDAADFREVITFRDPGASITIVDYSPDGRSLAVGGNVWNEAKEEVLYGTLALWDAATGNRTATFGQHPGGVSHLCFSPDGKRLASAGGENVVKVWDVVSGREIWTLEGHEANVNAVAYSPDGKLLASGSQDQTVKLWDALTGKELRSSEKYPGYVRSVTFFPDSRRLAVMSLGDKTVRVWDTRTGEDAAPLKGHTSGVMAIACCPDAHRLASSSADGTVRVWDTVTGQEVLWVRVDPAMALTVAISPDGKRLAGASGLTMRLWNATPPE